MKNALLILLFTNIISCRPEPGPHYYESQEDFSQSHLAGGNFLSGEVPYESGTPRLDIGVFYEGESSEVIAINETDIFYYIYDQVQADESRKTTFTQTSDVDHVEGTQSDHFLMSDLGWFGCGVHWDSPRDLSQWTHFALNFKSSSASVSNINIGMNNVIDENEFAVFVAASDYGFRNDGTWHRVVIPLSDFTSQGLDLSSIRSPLILSSGTLSIEPGDELLVDDVYLFVGGNNNEQLSSQDSGPN